MGFRDNGVLRQLVNVINLVAGKEESKLFKMQTPRTAQLTKERLTRHNYYYAVFNLRSYSIK